MYFKVLNSFAVLDVQQKSLRNLGGQIPGQGGQIADFYQYFKSTIGSMVFLSRSSLVVILYIGNFALNVVTTVIVIWNLFKSQVAKLYKDKAVKFLKTD